jgi:hypothetical protein
VHPPLQDYHLQYGFTVLGLFWGHLSLQKIQSLADAGRHGRCACAVKSCRRGIKSGPVWNELKNRGLMQVFQAARRTGAVWDPGAQGKDYQLFGPM